MHSTSVRAGDCSAEPPTTTARHSCKGSASHVRPRNRRRIAFCSLSGTCVARGGGHRESTQSGFSTLILEQEVVCCTAGVATARWILFGHGCSDGNGAGNANIASPPRRGRLKPLVQGKQRTGFLTRKPLGSLSVPWATDRALMLAGVANQACAPLRSRSRKPPEPSVRGRARFRAARSVAANRSVIPQWGLSRWMIDSGETKQPVLGPLPPSQPAACAVPPWLLGPCLLAGLGTGGMVGTDAGLASADGTFAAAVAAVAVDRAFCWPVYRLCVVRLESAGLWTSAQRARFLLFPAAAQALVRRPVASVMSQGTEKRSPADGHRRRDPAHDLEGRPHLALVLRVLFRLLAFTLSFFSVVLALLLGSISRRLRRSSPSVGCGFGKALLLLGLLLRIASRSRSRCSARRERATSASRLCRRAGS